MSDRMTDERLATFNGLGASELLDALVAERARVVRLETALTDLARDAQHLALVAGWPKAVANQPRARARAVLAEGATK